MSFEIGVLTLGSFLLAFYSSSSLCSWLLALRSGGLIEGATGQIIFVIALSLLGGIAIIFMEPIAIKCSTAICGAFLTCYGIDLLAQTGYSQFMLQFLGNPSLRYQTTTGSYILAATTAVLAALGMLVQFRRPSQKKA